MEIWKEIKGYEGLYSVSNFGNVKSLKRTVDYKNGLTSNYNERVLSQESVKGGYKRVAISKNNKTKRFQVQRLVAIEFINNPKNKPCVNHINGIKDDNRVQNLEWVTYSENERHSYDILGKVNNNRKLNSEQIDYIRKNCIKGIISSHFYSAKSISLRMNVSKETVLNVLKNKYYI